MRVLPDFCIPMTLTSPPYDNLYRYGGHAFDFETIAAELFRVTMVGGVVVWIIQEQIVDGSETGTSSRQRLFFQQLGFRLHHTMVMQPYAGRTHSHVRYGGSLQYAFILSKGQPRNVNLIRDHLNSERGRTRRFTGRTHDGRVFQQPFRTTPTWGARGGVWFYATGRHIAEEAYTKLHPARMAEQIARDHILSWSRPGDLIFDPFAGVGTTCKMAFLSDRRYLGMEIFGPYWVTALRRLAEARQLRHGLSPRAH
jgi:site-specific DNA-methyltransferase (adenine-specific)